MLTQRPDKLMLVSNEMFPSSRSLEAEVPATSMEGIEHLGQYVFEMTQAKLKAMGNEEIVVDETSGTVDPSDKNETMLEVGEEYEDEADTLHESVI